MNSSDKLNHTTLSEKIKNYLIDCIINKKIYQPGDKIVETKIAEELNVSQSPVREAIKDLKVMGFVESKPYKGSYVKKMSLKEFKEVYTLRIALEEIAIKEAINNITPDQVNKLQNIVEEMIVSADDLVVHTELDNKFHHMIFEISNNNTLLKIWDQLGVKYWIYKGITFLASLESYNYLEQAKNHQPICTAIKNKDTKKAVELIKSHYGKHIEIIKKNEDKLQENNLSDS